jgi:hypothetical protein
LTRIELSLLPSLPHRCQEEDLFKIVLFFKKAETTFSAFMNLDSVFQEVDFPKNEKLVLLLLNKFCCLAVSSVVHLYYIHSGFKS